MASLIGFDMKRKNLEFSGHSKLCINFVSNQLLVEPKNENFKLIPASFKFDYVMKKNILFVFSDHKNMDFCLVFKNQQICSKIFDCIASQKTANEPSQNRSIDDSFIIPMLQTISNNPTLNSDLCGIIAEWHQLLNEGDKDKYANLMKEFNIYHLILTSAGQVKRNEISQIQSRKRKFKDIKKEAPDYNIEKRVAYKIPKNYSKSIPPSQFALFSISARQNRKLIVFNFDKTFFHEYKAKLNCSKFQCSITRGCQAMAFIDVNEESNEICVKMSETKHPCKPFTKIPENYNKIRMIQKPDYEIIENFSRGSKELLIVFDSVDRNYCYEYSYNSGRQQYFCRGCTNRRIRVASRADICNEGTPREYVEILNDHLCQKREYNLEKYQPIYNYVLAPYYEIQNFFINGKEGKTLIILDEKDRSKCHQYSYNHKFDQFYCRECKKRGKCVSAKLRRNFEGEQYVILSNIKHICQRRPYVPAKVILRQPKFEIMEETNDGISRIWVFGDKNDYQKKCYLFCKHPSAYYCVGCQAEIDKLKKNKKAVHVKRVTGNLVKDAKTAEYSFQMKPNQVHCCEPKKYQPEVYQVFPKTLNFFYFRKKILPNSLNLAIKHPENQKLCYAFTHSKHTNSFYCYKCQAKKQGLHVKLQKDSVGPDFFRHNFKAHCCKPQKLSSITHFG